MIEERAQKYFKESLEVEHMLGRDDWHLCEGLLQIFLKGGSKQTIAWQEQNLTSNNHNGSSYNPSRNSMSAASRMVSKQQQNAYYHNN